MAAKRIAGSGLETSIRPGISICTSDALKARSKAGLLE